MNTISEQEKPSRSTGSAAFDYARSGKTTDLESLLADGLSPDSSDSRGQSLLMLASYHGHLEASELLIKYGAQPDLPNKRGQTPLGGVAFKGHTPIAELLIKQGADVNADNGFGMTPLSLARMSGQTEVAQLLLANGARDTIAQKALSFPGHLISSIRK
ncbi:MAG: ankyrin repeat domain-containing protein [Verrucomicrobiota bacterium]